jgi:hypothetical protein
VQDPPKFTQISIFGLNIYHLATLMFILVEAKQNQILMQVWIKKNFFFHSLHRCLRIFNLISMLRSLFSAICAYTYWAIFGIFGDFCQLSATKIGVFLKNQCRDHFFGKKLAVV